jgi:hypothetical protein
MAVGLHEHDYQILVNMKVKFNASKRQRCPDGVSAAQTCGHAAVSGSTGRAIGRPLAGGDTAVETNTSLMCAAGTKEEEAVERSLCCWIREGGRFATH